MTESAGIMGVLFSLNYQYPLYLLLLIPLLLILWYVLFKTQVVFEDKKQEKEYAAFLTRRQWLRLSVLGVRTLAVMLLVLSLAAPYLITEVAIQGDKNVKLLVDESTSFSLFDQSVAKKVEETLKDLFPTSVKVIATGTESHLGDEILASMSQNDNIFLITDGNTNGGRTLADLGFYATVLNVSISAINVEMLKQDASITVLGPSKTVSNVENNFYVVIENPNQLSYTVVVTIDGEEVLREETSQMQIPFTHTFAEGEHTIVAELVVNDAFAENNKFYKTLEVLPKPKILFVSKKDSPLQAVLEELYLVTRQLSLPTTSEQLSEYSAIVINDIPKLSTAQVELLSSYVVDGNGLFVVGGIHSFDQGDYEGSFFETLLPVRIGQGDKIEGGTNVVLVIDISGSTGQGFGGGSVVDYEKAQAVSILDDLRPGDKVALVAFNAQAFELTSLLPIQDVKATMTNQIERLKDGGGTMIAAGLASGINILGSVIGSKQIVLISDGRTQAPDQAIAMAEEASRQGIQVYTVGVGGNTDEEHLRRLAVTGLGSYYAPGETQRLRLAFGRLEQGKEGEGGWRLGIADTTHFITQDLEIDATVGGFNQVIPKSAARALITTQDGHPIVTVWRFGLGRVAVLSTDDGTWYGGELLSPKNSQVISRSINWAIGDLNRKREYYVAVKDTFIDQDLDIWLRSPQTPDTSTYAFEKVDERLYNAQHTAAQTGFEDILGKNVAVNYNSEYQKVGVNPELEDFVVRSGGMMVDPDDVARMKALVESGSLRSKKTTKYYRWPFLLIALLLLVTEICIRRVIDNFVQGGSAQKLMFGATKRI